MFTWWESTLIACKLPGHLSQILSKFCANDQNFVSILCSFTKSQHEMCSIVLLFSLIIWEIVYRDTQCDVDICRRKKTVSKLFSTQDNFKLLNRFHRHILISLRFISSCLIPDKDNIYEVICAF